MILNDNSTQQINTLVIQLQNRITNLNNEFRNLNKEISDLDTEISDLERKVSSNENDASDMNTEISDLERRISSNANDIAAMSTEISANTEAISGKADKSHTHTKSEITDFPTSLKNPNALTINGKTYDGSTAVDAGVQAVANGGTGVTTQAEINKAFIGDLEVGDSDVTDSTEFVSSYASNNGFSDTNAINKPYRRKFSAVWNYIKDKISSVLGLTATAYGNVQIGGAGVTGSKLTIQGNSIGSNSYEDTNPKLEFKNDDGTQNLSLTFSDADAVQDPASITLNGNQGNEYFIAPNIKATGNFYGNLSGTADKAVEVVDYGDTSRTVKIGYIGQGVTADKLLYLAGYTEHEDSSVKLKDVNKEELIKWLGIPRIKYADYTTPTQTFTQFEQVPIELSKFSSEVTPNNVLCFMVIYWSGVQLIASADWGSSASSGLKCALIALKAGTGGATIRCVYMV